MSEDAAPVPCARQMKQVPDSGFHNIFANTFLDLSYSTRRRYHDRGAATFPTSQQTPPPWVCDGQVGSNLVLAHTLSTDNTLVTMSKHVPNGSGFLVFMFPARFLSCSLPVHGSFFNDLGEAACVCCMNSCMPPCCLWFSLLLYRGTSLMAWFKKFLLSKLLLPIVHASLQNSGSLSSR